MWVEIRNVLTTTEYPICNHCTLEWMIIKITSCWLKSDWYAYFLVNIILFFYMKQTVTSSSRSTFMILGHWYISTYIVSPMYKHYICTCVCILVHTLQISNSKLLLFKTLECYTLLCITSSFSWNHHTMYSSLLLMLTLKLLASFKNVTNRENIKCRNGWEMQPCLATFRRQMLN